MKLSTKILLTGCICLAVLSDPRGAAFGQEACCLPDDTCVNVVVLSCTDLGGTPMGVGSVCLGDNNGDGFDDLCVSPIIISEYYESSPGSRKCIELFNPGTTSFDLGANGYRLGLYTVQGAVTNRVTGARGIYFFGSRGVSEIVLAGDVFLICAVANGDPFEANIDLFLPFDPINCPAANGGGANCDYGFSIGTTGNSPVNAFNGDDELVLFGPDINTPFDNVADVFGVPGQGDLGPRGANPSADVAWERKFSARGVRDFNGFDPCNFDGLKAGATTPTPPGTPANLACLNALDISTSNQWIFEGLNPFGNNQNHTLGSHVADAAPIASSIQAITKLNTDVQLTLAVVDIDGDPFNTFVDTLPAVGTIWDGDPAMGGININLAGVPYTMTTSFVTFVPDAGVGTDASIDFHGEQISPIQIGNTATASLLVEDEGVIMTEVLYDPNSAQPESQWEWVEIHNTTGAAVTLGELNNTNCPVCDDNLITDPAGAATPLTIGPGEIIVIVGNITTATPRTDPAFLDLWGLVAAQVFFVDGNLHPPGTGEFPFLANAGTQLSLRDPTGDLIDFLPNYGNAPFPSLTNDAGSSIFLTSTDLDNSNGANWAISAVDCANGSRQVSDTSIASPGVVPGIAASILPPCASSGLSFTQVGSPKTITLQGTLGGNAPIGTTLGFQITSLPSVQVNAAATLPLGQLWDGTDTNPITGTKITSVPHTVLDAAGQVTLVEGVGLLDPNLAIRHFYSFEYKAVEILSGGGTGAASNAAVQTIAVQGNTLVITEIMANPANTLGGTETYWEYLEVRNTTGSPVTISSMQSTNGTTFNGFNVNGVLNITIPANTTRLIARDALDGSTDPVLGQRTRAAFQAEWTTIEGTVTAGDVIYVPNNSGPAGNKWDGLSNDPFAPGRFVTIWENTGDLFSEGLLDVVVYQNGQNGWPANSEPNSIFYRGNANPGAFTTTGNDDPLKWQESTPGCPGDASRDSFVDIIGGDSTADHGSPLDLPTNPDQCVPSLCGTCLGDLNGDSKANGGDIQLFIDTVLNPGFPLQGCADMNGDGNALDYVPDISLFVDALVFGNANCPVLTTHTTNITIDLLGAPPAAADVELFIGGCDPAVACGALATPSFICFERVTVTAATTATDLALALAFGADGTKDGIGGLDEFCLPDGADVTVVGSTIKIVFTRAAGLVTPCCYVQDTDGTFSIISPFDFMLVGGANNCVVTNLANGVPNDETAADGTSGFKFTKSE